MTPAQCAGGDFDHCLVRVWGLHDAGFGEGRGLAAGASAGGSASSPDSFVLDGASVAAGGDAVSSPVDGAGSESGLCRNEGNRSDSGASGLLSFERGGFRRRSLRVAELRMNAGSGVSCGGSSSLSSPVSAVSADRLLLWRGQPAVRLILRLDLGGGVPARLGRGGKGASSAGLSGSGSSASAAAPSGSGCSASAC